ncbi:RES family NAD+ phosphorylase [Ramlibacter rhizophilus]|uniref:RES domain-containing protein n=1 Tax=Ramlibacter rhizophilus TaxID=1781167 RepID=A0A4Z0BWN7_9BURK|nr:RES family NAD+ phosphorylase [Ramlibacter rhizophilus]TFZ03321.1 RES domain-containing protein [Ramlibacter rhizophilus]
MTQAEWPADWFERAAPARRDLWRGVEAQHQVATMRLVDDLDEQHLLEQLLEASKPPLPPGCERLHYLIATPFRYRSPWPSRFRRADHAGVWYGADAPATVAHEIAYWRWRFFMDSDGLREGELVNEFTFFRARFSGSELDLSAPPWDARRQHWRDPDDYVACQRLADAVRTHSPVIDAIRYESARHEGGRCQAVLEPKSLRLPQPHAQQTWACKITARRVLFAHGGEWLQIEFGGGESPRRPPSRSG